MNINYNDVNEVKKYVRSLDKLREFSAYRYKLGYIDKVELKDIKIINDDIWFDSCGNTLVREKVGNNAYIMKELPAVGYACSHCGETFELHRLVTDCVPRKVRGKKLNDKIVSIYEFYHNKCNLYDKEETQRAEFQKLFAPIYNLSIENFRTIPNKYCNCDSCAPWFKVSTPDGDIEIGWRKRVVHIRWLNYKEFTEKFDDEDVTKGFGYYGESERLIHAWSVDKAIEYLTRAKQSIAD